MFLFLFLSCLWTIAEATTARDTGGMINLIMNTVPLGRELDQGQSDDQSNERADNRGIVLKVRLDRLALGGQLINHPALPIEGLQLEVKDILRVCLLGHDHLIQADILVGAAQVVADHPRQESAGQHEDRQDDHIHQDPSHALLAALFYLVRVGRTDRVHRAGIVAQLTIDARVLRDLHHPDREARDQSQKGAIGANEAAERPSGAAGKHDEDRAKRNHASVAAHPEDADKGIEVADDKTAPGSRVEDGESQIDPRHDPQKDRYGAGNLEIFHVDQVLKRPKGTDTSAKDTPEQEREQDGQDKEEENDPWDLIV